MNEKAKLRYKEIEFPFICPITKREFNSGKGLSIYLTKTLKVEHSDYYNKYINHRDSSCFFCGKKGKFISASRGYRNLCDDDLCVKKSFNSHSIEGIMYRRFVSREEAEILFEKENQRQLEERMKTQEKLRKEDPLWDKKRSRNCKEFWIEKGYSEEESVIKTQEVMNEIHEKTFKKFKKYPKKYASKYPTKIEYYLAKGFTLEESKEKLTERQTTFSKEICIEKYGKEEGLKIWMDRQEKWIETMDSKPEEEKIEINRKKLFNNSGYSKISQELFWKIYKNFKNNNVHFEELNSEIIRYDKANKLHYRYDYFDFTLKKCIEFNGDYWHCNPIKYNENYNHPVMNKRASEIWEKDKLKLNWLKNRGYKVLVIWESDYRKNPEETLEKCLSFLNHSNI